MWFQKLKLGNLCIKKQINFEVQKIDLFFR